MDAITIDPLLIHYGLPALGAGLLLGVLVAWLIGRRRHRAFAAMEPAMRPEKSRAWRDATPGTTTTAHGRAQRRAAPQ